MRAPGIATKTVGIALFHAFLVFPQPLEAQETPEIFAQGETKLPDRVRLDVRPSGTALSAAVQESIERHLTSIGVAVSQRAETTLEVKLNSASSRDTIDLNRLRVFGKGGSESDLSYGIVADLQSRSDHKAPIASLNMLLFDSGGSPLWSGTAFRGSDRPQEAPLTISGWIGLSDALLTHIGETVGP